MEKNTDKIDYKEARAKGAEIVKTKNENIAKQKAHTKSIHDFRQKQLDKNAEVVKNKLKNIN